MTTDICSAELDELLQNWKGTPQRTKKASSG